MQRTSFVDSCCSIRYYYTYTWSRWLGSNDFRVAVQIENKILLYRCVTTEIFAYQQLRRVKTISLLSPYHNMLFDIFIVYCWDNIRDDDFIGRIVAPHYNIYNVSTHESNAHGVRPLPCVVRFLNLIPTFYSVRNAPTSVTVGPTIYCLLPPKAIRNVLNCTLFCFSFSRLFELCAPVWAICVFRYTTTFFHRHNYYSP